VSAIANLTNLTKLWLGNNQISDVSAIAHLTNLTELWLDNNQISEVSAIANLTNLTELYLSNNQISEVSAIANLTNLTTLSLHNNQISDVSAIANLTNLTELWLDNNQISDVSAIANLTNLTVLSLHNNQISDVSAIANLTNLTELGLSNNQISDVSAIANLTNLTVLSLHNIQISDVSAIANLTNLTTLYLSNNQISDVSAIAHLTNLTKLGLSNNQISDVSAIANLTNLTTLDLENNRMNQIPGAIEQFKQLEKLDLRGNPINIPPDMLAPKAGETWPDARLILDYYFRTQDPNQAMQLYEVKLLIVGEGGSGKTSLARKLLDSDYQLLAETEDTSTEGIDILRWEFIGRNQQLYRINIWDFGGQEIYHQTHQFFLTERSLYLLVADSRKEDTDHYFWLQIIRLLSNDSPVLLIQNEKQNRTCNLNLRELRAEFASLGAPLSTNLADNRGLAEVRTAIQRHLEDLLPDGIPFPITWLNVRYALENDGRNYIDFADYEGICRYHGIPRREEMCDLSRFLHNLGICLHFQKDPLLRRRLILKPNWGTAAVYKILDDSTVKQQLGQFNTIDLDRIWQDNQYVDMRDELLQLMKEFKVCYEIPRRPGNFIAPHLLSPNPPDYPWDDRPNLILRYHYRGFMPKGILTRFIVEMHEAIEDVSDPDRALVWKHGVVLIQDRARAEVIERAHNREIRIRVSGRWQRDFLMRLNYEFEKIHKSFERLSYDTLIPCNCTTCKASPDPYTYPLDRLRQFIDQRRVTIQCYESSEDVNVRRLLDDSIEPAFDPRSPWFGDRHGDKMEWLMMREMGEWREPSDRFNINIINTNQPTGHKTMTENINNLQGANIGNFANEVKDHARQQANQHIHQSSNSDLVQAAKDIKALLDQLDHDYDRTTPTGQAMISAKAIEAIEKNPTLKARVVNALKEGGTTALESAIDHPAVTPVVALIKGFMDAK
jgi:Leucine-rich repeat (LRR) protein